MNECLSATQSFSRHYISHNTSSFVSFVLNMSNNSNNNAAHFNNNNKGHRQQMDPISCLSNVCDLPFHSRPAMNLSRDQTHAWREYIASSRWSLPFALASPRWCLLHMQLRVIWNYMEILVQLSDVDDNHMCYVPYLCQVYFPWMK